jgi:hypothetical protein
MCLVVQKKQYEITFKVKIQLQTKTAVISEVQLSLATAVGRQMFDAVKKSCLIRRGGEFFLQTQYVGE